MNVTPSPGILSTRSSSLQNKEDRIARLKSIYGVSSRESRQPSSTTKRTTTRSSRSKSSSGVVTSISVNNNSNNNYMSPNPNSSKIMDGESSPRNSLNEAAREITPVKSDDTEAKEGAATINNTASNDATTPTSYCNNQDQTTPSPQPDWPLKDIHDPGPNDCLFGRGGGTNHHVGNKKYRKMVDEKKEKYLSSKRLDKPLVAMEIINAWRSLDPPGRFLKQDERTKLWSDVGDRKAREKTSQALREKTPSESHHRGGESHKETRFQPGTLSPGGRMRPGLAARDHSLGTEPMGAHDMSLEGFSWDETDRPVVDSRGADLNNHHYHHRHPEGAAPYPPYHVREHSLATNPLPEASTSNPAPPFGDPYYYHHYHPHYPPPPHHHYPYPPPPPPHYQSPQGHHQHDSSTRQREHSLQMNPLKGANTTQPARDTFTDPKYEGQQAPPPPLPPPPHSYYYPPVPPHHWGAPPPPHHAPPPQYYPGAQSSAFSQYDGTTAAMRSPSNSSDQYDDRPLSGGGEEVRGTSQDFKKIAKLFRDTTEGTLNRSSSADDSNEGKRSADEQGVIQKSHSMPVENELSRFPSPPKNSPSKKQTDGEMSSSASKDVRKPSLMKKISGGSLQSSTSPVTAPEGAIRPEPVKRDTSNQPETLETKRSTKRVILSRDKSAIAKSLKEAQRQKDEGVKLSSKLSKADLDRKLSVEINKLGLNDTPIPLDRMTTTDVLESLMDDENLASPLSQPPESLSDNDRVDSIDVVAQDIYNGGNRLQSVEWDDTLDLLVQGSDDANADPDPSAVAVNDDIAARWISGESANTGTEI
ncbi:hypothetical protein ACHAWC_011845 [Mediolabrus comicus]